jgi:hypothetical protein
MNLFRFKFDVHVIGVITIGIVDSEEAGEAAGSGGSSEDNRGYYSG